MKFWTKIHQKSGWRNTCKNHSIVNAHALCPVHEKNWQPGIGVKCGRHNHSEPSIHVQVQTSNLRVFTFKFWIICTPTCWETLNQHQLMSRTDPMQINGCIVISRDISRFHYVLQDRVCAHACIYTIRRRVHVPGITNFGNHRVIEANVIFRLVLKHTPDNRMNRRQSCGAKPFYTYVYVNKQLRLGKPSLSLLVLLLRKRLPGLGPSKRKWKFS